MVRRAPFCQPFKLAIKIHLARLATLLLVAACTGAVIAVTERVVTTVFGAGESGSSAGRVALIIALWLLVALSAFLVVKFCKYLKAHGLPDFLIERLWAADDKWAASRGYESGRVTGWSVGTRDPRFDYRRECQPAAAPAVSAPRPTNVRSAKAQE